VFWVTERLRLSLQKLRSVRPWVLAVRWNVHPGDTPFMELLIQYVGRAVQVDPRLTPG